MHRNFKPDNIVLTLDRPIIVALIDFERSLPKTNLCHSGIRGTPTYEPEKAGWHDGSYLWDYYALACIVVECDMEKDAYFIKKNEFDSKAAIKKHVENKGTCEHLFELANRVILNYKGYDEDPSLDELEVMIRNIKFRQYK